MPADAWGHIPLRVQILGKPDAELYLSEHRLIADPAVDHHVMPSSVLMGAGRGRIRREIRGWTDRADFDQMLRDRHTLTVRVLVLEDGTMMPSRIVRLEGHEDAATDTVWFVAEFLEA